MSTPARRAVPYWPELLRAFGPRYGGRPISRCSLCQPETHISLAHTFVHYGNTPICLEHARRQAEREAS